ncbi:hypothetical protein [Nitratireductor rhodophyticola]
MQQTIATEITAENAFASTAIASEVSGETWEAMYALRHAADFLEHASALIANGATISDPEVVDHFRWGIMKAFEFNNALSEPLRGDLSRDCFVGCAGGC